METESTELRARLQATLGTSYTLERELGGGGMSRVFVAADARLDRRVVVKVLPPDRAAGISARRFEREVRLAARLQHPHIVPLLSAGEIDGLPYYTMPFVEGESLRARLTCEATLPLTDAVRLVRELADALGYAHGQGVVHRDLKPENVLLSGGHAVVADFGIAKALSAATHGTPTTAMTTGLGVTLGTPAYMAPEQAAGDDVDHRADLYALGVIAYELLAGAHPFAGRTQAAVLAAHLTEVPAPLPARRPDVPPTVAALVMRLLAKRPEDRPQTAEEIVQTLDGLTTPAGGTIVRRTFVRRRTAVMLLGTALAIGGVGAVVRARHPAPTPPAAAGAPLVARRIAVAPFENQTGDSALSPLGRLTGDWITQGLAEAGFAEVVDPETIRLTWQMAPNAHALAVTTRARLVVSGAYYVEGDSIRLLARISDAAADNVLRALEPVSAPITAPRPAIALLRERVLGALGGLLDVRTDTWAAASGLPPSLAAYRHWSTGLELYFRHDFQESTREFVTANRVDSSFILPLVWAAVAQTVLGTSATADSLLRVADRSREHLTPSDRYLLDKSWAELRGDWAGALTAAREMVRVAPASAVALAIVGWNASRVNRPVEAIAALTRLDPERPPMRQYAPYWTVLTLAQHSLGDYRSELAAAEHGRRLHPDRPMSLYNEARALAALGRLEGLERRLDEIVELPEDPEFRSVDVLEALGAELRAHGHPADAEAAFARALRWYAERPAAERATPTWRARYAAALYTAGRFDEARGLIEQLTVLPADAPPRAGNLAGVFTESLVDEVDRRGYLGVLAARRGDRAPALAADSALAASRRPYLNGRHTYWRARIAALLGDREGAVALLRQAIQEGRMYPELHAQMDLAPLHGLPAFEELIRHKG